MNSKLLILATIAIVSLAQYTPAEPNPTCTPRTGYANEQECVYYAAMPTNLEPNGGSCYTTDNVNPYSGCFNWIVAPCRQQCVNYCERCFACIWNWGCCEAGAQSTENMSQCLSFCESVSVGTTCPPYPL